MTESSNSTQLDSDRGKLNTSASEKSVFYESLFSKSS